MRPRLRAVQRGRLAALGSATAFSVVSALARIAYETGASPGAVVIARIGSGTLAGAAIVALLNRPWSIPRAEWAPTVAVGVAWMMITVGYMASFFYIPVSLAVLIFYTYPVLISLLGPAVARRRPEWLTFAGALLAFAGLALALGPDLGTLDWRGCALAFMASAGATATFIIGQRLVVEQDMFAFSFHMHVACVAILVLALPASGWPDLPAGAGGWLALVGVGVFYMTATILQFAAIRLAGPARASVASNAEPVVTMLGAAAVLGERLGPWQLAGAALVVAAVVLSAYTDPPESG